MPVAFDTENPATYPAFGDLLRQQHKCGRADVTTVTSEGCPVETLAEGMLLVLTGNRLVDTFIETRFDTTNGRVRSTFFEVAAISGTLEHDCISARATYAGTYAVTQDTLEKACGPHAPKYPVYRGERYKM